jgi:prophage regulatory protein
MDNNQNKNEHTINRPQLVCMKAAIKMLGTSRASLYRWIHAGTFPAPVKIGERAIAFKLSELEKWIESRPRVQLNGTNKEGK